MKIIVDTNVALDYLLHRENYVTAKIIYFMAEQNLFTGYISASAITDIFFLSKGDLGKKPAIEALKKLLQVFHPATVTDSLIYQALYLGWNDFEDSVQYVVGESLEVNYIITRNTSDYTAGSITAVTPAEFIDLISD